MVFAVKPRLTKKALRGNERGRVTYFNHKPLESMAFFPGEYACRIRFKCLLKLVISHLSQSH